MLFQILLFGYSSIFYTFLLKQIQMCLCFEILKMLIFLIKHSNVWSIKFHCIANSANSVWNKLYIKNICNKMSSDGNLCRALSNVCQTLQRFETWKQMQLQMEQTLINTVANNPNVRQSQTPVNRQRSWDQQMDINRQGREHRNQGTASEVKSMRSTHKAS